MVSRSQFSVAGQSLQYYVIHGPTPEGDPAPLHRADRPAGARARLVVRAVAVDLVHHELRRGDASTRSSTAWPSGTCRSRSSTSTASGCASSTGATSSGTRRPSPTPPACSRGCTAKGLKICVWINPYIAQRSHLFAEGRELGYLVRTTDGDVWQWDLWQAGMALVDFTNPDACAWFTSKLKVLLDQGVDAFKTDFGERIPTEGVRLARRLRPGRDAQLLRPALQPVRLRPAGGRARARARRCCSPARRRPAGSSSRCTGAATASRPSSRWPSRCAAGCPWRCPASATGATTSAASRARPTRPSSSAGWRSACCRRTRGCTAPAPTGCRGPSTRRRWTSPGRSPGSSCR